MEAKKEGVSFGTDKNFDQWNGEKKLLHAGVVPVHFYYYEREVWWCSVGVNVGVEADGKHAHFERPVLIIKKFNKEMFWGLPLTSRQKIETFYFCVHHDAGESWAALTQIKTLSTKRLLRKIGMITEEEFFAIHEKLCALLTIEPQHNAGVLGGRSH